MRFRHRGRIGLGNGRRQTQFFQQCRRSRRAGIGVEPPPQPGSGLRMRIAARARLVEGAFHAGHIFRQGSRQKFVRSFEREPAPAFEFPAIGKGVDDGPVQRQEIHVDTRKIRQQHVRPAEQRIERQPLRRQGGIIHDP